MGNRRLGKLRFGKVQEHHLASAGGIVSGSAFTSHDPHRVYYEEYWLQKPGLNALLSSSAGNFPQSANKNWEVLGTNMTTALCTFGTSAAGITVQTAGADNDQCIIFPHADDGQSILSGSAALLRSPFGSQNMPAFETVLKTDAASIDATSIRAGFNTTAAAGAATLALETDQDAAFFLYADNDDLGTITNNSNWHFVVAKNDATYVSDLGVTVEAGKLYRLGIYVDKNRRVSAYLNGKQYSITQTSASGGTTTGRGTQKSAALRNTTFFYPNVSLQAHVALKKVLSCCYIKLSRHVYRGG
jgi:hypothetical protein